MALTVVFFKEDNGSIPLFDWLESLAPKARPKVLFRLERLREMGHALRRPEADFLRSGLYELRLQYMNVQYRVLYFFHGVGVVVVSHGLAKERSIPEREIEKALDRKRRYEENPEKYSAGVMK